MKHHVSKFLGGAVCVFASLMPVHGSALTYADAVEALSDQDLQRPSFQDHGYLCEKLAMLKMSESYDKSQLASSIVYSRNGRVIGELDVVVFDRDGLAQTVIEVKCRKSYTSAMNSASKQLTRFQGVAGRCDYDYVDKKGKRYDCSAFKSPIDYTAMSYTDAQRAGFELSFDLSRDQVLQLVDELR